MSTQAKEQAKEVKKADKILRRISVLVDPVKTPKPNLQDDEELRLLCRELTGV